MTLKEAKQMFMLRKEKFELEQEFNSLVESVEEFKEASRVKINTVMIKIAKLENEQKQNAGGKEDQN